MRRLEWQPDVCDRCGGDAFRPATRREELVRWVTQGAGAGTARYCRNCDASCSGRSGHRVLYRTSASGWRRRVRLPVDVLAAVRGARSWEPVPGFYAVVGGVALVPAMVIAVRTRVRWWVAIVGVPVTAMVTAFLWSLASAIGRRRRDVLWRLAPERAWRQNLAEELTGMREQIGGFPLLVPEGWPGALSLDGGSWAMPARGPRVLQDVRIIADHGDPQLDPERHAPGWRPSTPWVEIRSTRDARPTPEAQALREFVERAFPESQLDLDGVEPTGRREMERRILAAHRDHEQQQQRREAELAGSWRDGSIQVDGVAIPARLLTHADTQVGVAGLVHDGRDILIIGEGIDLATLTFVPVADPTPLVDEFERRRRRIFPPSSS